MKNTPAYEHHQQTIKFDLGSCLNSNSTPGAEARYLPKEFILNEVLSKAKAVGIVRDGAELLSMLNEIVCRTLTGLRPSDIDWTEMGWSCLVGCTKVSAACRFCYAKWYHDKMHAMYLKGGGFFPGGRPIPKQFAYPFEVVQFLEERLGSPLLTRKPQRVFVNAFSDVFHESVPLELIQAMFIVMGSAPQHRFQVLTKRADRLLELADRLPWFDNIWMGVTVENRAELDRVECLRSVPARVRWLSIEPLLEDLGDVNLEGIHWVVVGGESGSKDQDVRPMHPDWVRRIRHQCAVYGVPFFFKQAGDWIHEHQIEFNGICSATLRTAPWFDWLDGTRSYRVHKRVSGHLFDGLVYREYPEGLDLRSKDVGE